MTIDPSLRVAATRAVGEGRAGSLSAWVNQALVERAAKDRRLRALADAVAAFEAEFGEITSAELALQERLDRRDATVVRPRRRRRRA